MLRLTIVIAPLLLGAACARELTGPPAAGEVCERDADCNRDAGAARCGSLRLCVTGRCEVDAGSQRVVCD